MHSVRESFDGEDLQHDVLSFHARVQGLRGSFARRSVLLAGRLATSLPLLKLLRRAGARVTAAEDLETALRLAARMPVDFVVVDSGDDTIECDTLELTLRNCRASGVAPMLVRLPSRSE